MFLHKYSFLHQSHAKGKLQALANKDEVLPSRPNSTSPRIDEWVLISGGSLKAFGKEKLFSQNS